MHEFGLLRSVAAAVERAANEAGATRVTEVALRVGDLSGAVPEALLGSWPMVVAGTPLADATLSVEPVGAAIWCPVCAAERPIDAFFALACPVCDTPTGQLVRGREFEIAWVEWDVDDQSSHDPST